MELFYCVSCFQWQRNYSGILTKTILLAKLFSLKSVLLRTKLNYNRLVFQLTKNKDLLHLVSKVETSLKNPFIGIHDRRRQSFNLGTPLRESIPGFDISGSDVQ